MQDQFAAKLAELFDSRDLAQAMLDQLGYPRSQVPAWTDPTQFWTAVITELDDGAVAGLSTRALAHLAASNYRDNEVFREAADTDDAQSPTYATSSPTTLVVITGTQIDLYLQLVRETADPNAQLLYANARQIAVEIAEVTAEQEHELLTALSVAVHRLSPDAQVTLERHDYRPYLLERLVVHGPDGAQYELRSAPSTTTVADLAYAVTEQYTAAGTQAGRSRRSVVDHVTADGRGDRLDPTRTLHDVGIHEGDMLRVSAEATAGAVSRDIWRSALIRAKQQIREHEATTPGFHLQKVDDEDFPSQFTITFAVRGFGPPTDMSVRPLSPIIIDSHTVLIRLSPNYPLAPPSVLWLTPIFHPNVARTTIVGQERGTVCLGALLNDYHPGLDFGDLCQMLMDMAAYRNYDLRPAETGGEGFLNLEAAAWALSKEGERQINEIGGSSWHRPAKIGESVEATRRALNLAPAE